MRPRVDQMELTVEVHDMDKDLEAAYVFAAVAGLPYSSFLDSSLKGVRLGQHSFIAFDPYLVLTTKGRLARWERRGQAVETVEGDPFQALREALSERRAPRSWRDGSMPFSCGGIGYLSYELGRYVEKLPCSVVDDLFLPELAFCFYDKVIRFDHVSGRSELCTSAGSSREAKRLAAEALEQLEAGAAPDEERGGGKGGGLESGFSKDEYMASVARVKEYILAGDIYQANLSQRYSAPLNETPWSLYSRLRVLNAAPFSAFLNMGGFAVASSSPERFFEVRGETVETRPIKGTRPRCDTEAEDSRMKRELLSSAKDRAELSMIVDLERNDLGRVCDYGTVRVDEHAVLESYATVHHLVSTVTGRLAGRHDVVDLVKASFPGGSITGAPKIRSMEIIDELEPTERSVYTGAIGYIGFDGSTDLNIAIRTMILANGRAYWQVGGGIVADSDPLEEYEETLHKGRAMFETVKAQE
jgi:para-aminobenzoate synthetase component I